MQFLLHAMVSSTYIYVDCLFFSATQWKTDVGNVHCLPPSGRHHLASVILLPVFDYQRTTADHDRVTSNLWNACLMPYSLHRCVR